MPSVFRRRTPAALGAAFGAALGTALLLTSGVARAQVVYSGPLNRAIPTGNTGLNQNVVTGTFFTGPGAFPSCPGAGCNYDFSLFGNGTTVTTFFAPGGGGQTSPVAAAQRGYVASSANGTPLSLAAGTMVGSTSVFNGDATSSSTGNFLGGSGLIFGFRFRNEAGDPAAVYYGWARVTLPATGAGTLVDYAYNATAGAAIAAGDVGGPATPPAVVPEPSTYALVAAGLASVGVAARRRRAL